MWCAHETFDKYLVGQLIHKLVLEKESKMEPVAVS